MKIGIYNLNQGFLCDVQLEHREDDLITVQIPSGVAQNLELRQTLLLYDNERGLLSYESSLVFKKPDDRYTFRLEKLQGVLQRRSDIKVKTDFTTVVEFIPEESPLLLDEQGNEIEPEPEGIPVMVHDISAGGVLISFDQKYKFPVGSKFWFYFYEAERPLQVLCKIVREQKMERPNEETQEIERRNGYGCQFEGLSGKEESSIRGYVFKKQLEDKRKNGK